MHQHGHGYGWITDPHGLLELLLVQADGQTLARGSDRATALEVIGLGPAQRTRR